MLLFESERRVLHLYMMVLNCLFRFQQERLSASSSRSLLLVEGLGRGRESPEQAVQCWWWGTGQQCKVENSSPHHKHSCGWNVACSIVIACAWLNLFHVSVNDGFSAPVGFHGRWCTRWWGTCGTRKLHKSAPPSAAKYCSSETTEKVWTGVKRHHLVRHQIKSC